MSLSPLFDAPAAEIEAFSYGVSLIKQLPLYASVQIITDFSTILTQLESTKNFSQILLDTYIELLDLSNNYSIKFSKVDSHSNIFGNDSADLLAKRANLSSEFIKPIPIQCLKKHIKSLVSEKWTSSYACSKNNYFTKRHFPSLFKLKNFLTHFIPNQIIKEVIINHSHLQGHLHKIGLVPNRLCNLCQLEVEDWEHLLLYCSALIKNRIKLFQQFFSINSIYPTSLDDFFMNPNSFSIMIRFLSLSSLF